VQRAAGASMAFRGRVFAPTSAQGLPQPVAFFPLTEGAGSNVTSWPTPDYTGSFNRTGMQCAPRLPAERAKRILRYTFCPSARAS